MEIHRSKQAPPLYNSPDLNALYIYLQNVKKSTTKTIEITYDSEKQAATRYYALKSWLSRNDTKGILTLKKKGKKIYAFKEIKT